MRRFFYQADPPADKGEGLANKRQGEIFYLPETVFHHWCKVLRAKVGDQGILFDGLGDEYQVVLTQIDKKSAQVCLQAQHKIDRSAPFLSEIALVISRGERMDYAIQKATELGATAITPLFSQHGEVHLKGDQIQKKQTHWQQIALSACEQCGLNRPPLIFSPQHINDWLDTLPDQDFKLQNPQIYAKQKRDRLLPTMHAISQNTAYQAIFAHSPNQRLVLATPTESNIRSIDSALLQQFQQQTQKDEPLFFQLLIGAEGGLSRDEIVRAQDLGFLAWQIGDRVLRTETAPVVALASLQTLHALTV